MSERPQLAEGHTRERAGERRPARGGPRFAVRANDARTQVVGTAACGKPLRAAGVLMHMRFCATCRTRPFDWHDPHVRAFEVALW